MATQLLYTLVIPEDDQKKNSSSQKKRTTQQASVSNDFGTVEATGSNPGARPIKGGYKGRYAKLMAKELQELAQASDYGAVTWFTDDDDPLNDAYVTVESFDINPLNPREGIELWEFSGQLSEKGTARSHWRAVSTDPTSIDNPFDASGTDLVALPATATKVAWYDERGQTLENATAQSTISGRFIDVETYDPDEPSFNNPTLIAKVPYEDEGKMDARVWDDHNRAQEDDDGLNSWQKVFITGHNFKGSTVVENGLLKMSLDEDGESLTFEEWDVGAGSYTTVSLGTSGWVLDAENLSRVSPSRVQGQLRFKNTSTGNFHSLDYQVNRASNRVVFITPPNEGSIPSGLSTKLSPIADDWSNDAQQIQKVLARAEVNE